MQDDAVLQAVVARCSELGTAATRDAECLNAREAVDRLAVEKQAIDEAARKSIEEQEFERAREEHRARDEAERRRNEAQQRVDPYTMPLVKDPDPDAQTMAPGNG